MARSDQADQRSPRSRAASAAPPSAAGRTEIAAASAAPSSARRSLPRQVTTALAGSPAMAIDSASATLVESRRRRTSGIGRGTAAPMVDCLATRRENRRRVKRVVPRDATGSRRRGTAGSCRSERAATVRRWRRTAAARERRGERQVRSARLGGVLRDRRGHAVHRDSHLLDRVRRRRRPAHSGGRRSDPRCRRAVVLPQQRRSEAALDLLRGVDERRQGEFLRSGDRAG